MTLCTPMFTEHGIFIFKIFIIKKPATFFVTGMGFLFILHRRRLLHLFLDDTDSTYFQFS